MGDRTTRRLFRAARAGLAAAWLATAASAAPQALPPLGDEAEWQLVDRIALTVNEEARTEGYLMAGILRGAEPVTTPEEIEGRYQEVLTAEVKDMLVVQAGKDLGFDPQLLERQVDIVLEQHRERLGRDGVSRYLRLRSFSSADYREEARREVYATAWERFVVGREPGPSGRFSRDKFVRPGQLWFAYEQNRSALSEPTTVQVQQLIVSAASVGGPEAAEQLTVDLHRQITETGADFGELAEIYGQTEPGTRGVSRWLPLGELCERFPDLCEAFLDGAAVGDVSGVLPYRRDGTPVGYIVLKLLGRKEGRKTPFTDPEQQVQLEDLIVEQRDRYRTDLGLTELLEASYVWPEEAFRPPPAVGPQP